MKCPSCGYINAPGAKICGLCSAALNKEPEPPRAPRPSSPAPEVVPLENPPAGLTGAVAPPISPGGPAPQGPSNYPQGNFNPYADGPNLAKNPHKTPSWIIAAMVLPLGFCLLSCIWSYSKIAAENKARNAARVAFKKQIPKYVAAWKTAVAEGNEADSPYVRKGLVAIRFNRSGRISVETLNAGDGKLDWAVYKSLPAALKAKDPASAKMVLFCCYHKNLLGRYVSNSSASKSANAFQEVCTFTLVNLESMEVVTTGTVSGSKKAPKSRKSNSGFMLDWVGKVPVHSIVQRVSGLPKR